MLYPHLLVAQSLVASVILFVMFLVVAKVGKISEVTQDLWWRGMLFPIGYLAYAIGEQLPRSPDWKYLLAYFLVWALEWLLLFIVMDYSRDMRVLHEVIQHNQDNAVVIQFTGK